MIEERVDLNRSSLKERCVRDFAIKEYRQRRCWCTEPLYQGPRLLYLAHTAWHTRIQGHLALAQASQLMLA
jgi:hypothetical protein